MKHFTLAATLIGALALPLTATAQDGEGRALVETIFNTLDDTDRGFVDQGTFLNFGSDIFFSMDSDENNSISLGEFLSWDAGMIGIAEDAGRGESYETAMRVVFAFWDRNGDDKISRTEQRQSLNADFARADLDNDAVLTLDEFGGGFSVMVAARAAINPAPVE